MSDTHSDVHAGRGRVVAAGAREVSEDRGPLLGLVRGTFEMSLLLAAALIVAILALSML